MTKKVMPFILAFFLLFSSFGTASAAPLFKDVGDTYWAKDELAFLVKKGILPNQSNTYFEVNKEITRLEASEILIKALGLKINQHSKQKFKDVLPGDPDYKIVATIADQGIMNGTSDGNFNPNDKLTRAQMAVILDRAFQLKGESTYSFRDVGTTHWASKSIKKLFANEITTGYSDNTYKPSATLTKAQFAVFLARILNPDFKNGIACYIPKNTKKYTVNVAVTTLWKEPNKARAVDRPSSSNPADMEKWTNNMTLNQKIWLIRKIETQALYGEEVVILKSSGNWHQVAVKGQYSSKNKTGYPGWVPKSHITETYPNYEDCSIAIIDAPIASLYNSMNTSSKFMDISFNTRLPVIEVKNGWIHVQTPENGVKYLRTQDAKTFKNGTAIPKPTQKDIVESAKKFTGLPYLWAGTSGFGYDCSGFTYSIYNRHGIVIPRDSGVQAVTGTAVLKKDLQPGDLLFFAHDKGKGQVHHVGMYIGNGQMIHSPNTKKTVEVISINLEPYKSEFSGARRYLK